VTVSTNQNLPRGSGPIRGLEVTQPIVEFSYSTHSVHWQQTVQNQ